MKKNTDYALQDFIRFSVNSGSVLTFGDSGGDGVVDAIDCALLWNKIHF